MNRTDLSWALQAALPHAARTGPTAWVGIHVGAGEARVYATDDMTFGVARITTPPSDPCTLWLSTKEATELERFIRPTLKAHKEETIAWEVRELPCCTACSGREPCSDCYNTGHPHVAAPCNQELHVGCDQGTTKGFEAVVFDLSVPQTRIDHFMGLTAKISQSPTSTIMAADPALMARFAAAKRESGDRIWWYPRQAVGAGGRPFVKWIGTVGDYFIGAIAGMSIEDYQADPMASFQGKSEVAA